MVASAEYAAFLKEQLAPLGTVSIRRMFGKSGAFCEGVMFGMVTGNELYLRVDEQNKAAFAEAAKYPPINYRKGGQVIDLSFWRAPDRLMDDQQELLRWVRLALGAAHRVAAGRSKAAGRQRG